MKRMFNAILTAALLAIVGIGSAFAGALYDSEENNLIDAMIRGQTLVAPANHYIALYSVCPTDSTAGTEFTGGSYARVQIAASLANWAGTQAAGSTTASSGTGGTTSNNVAITFPAPTANWGTANCWGDTTASTAGSIRFYSPLTTPKTINNGDAAPSFAPGAATFQVDN